MAYEFAPSLSELFMRFYEVTLEGIVAKLSHPMTALFRCIIECSKFPNVYDYGSKKVHNNQSNKMKTFSCASRKIFQTSRCQRLGESFTQMLHCQFHCMATSTAATEFRLLQTPQFMIILSSFMVLAMD